MMRFLVGVLTVGLIGCVGSVWAHPGHEESGFTHPGHQFDDLEDSDHDRGYEEHRVNTHRNEGALIISQRRVGEKKQAEGVSGQGKYKFRVLHTSALLPSLAQRVVVRAHGGFAVDRRPGRGEIYFALPEAGLMQISSDFSLVRMLNSPDEIRVNNMHNATLWFDEEENGYLAFPANEARKVFTTTMTGMLKNTLEAPTGVSLTSDRANKYFAEGGELVPTDVEYVDGKYYIVTGYSRLDHVLTASVAVTKPDPAAVAAQSERARRFRGPLGPSVDVTWNPLAFGGKGNRPGMFGTGHGVTLAPDGESIVVSDRPNAELERFSLKGEYLDRVALPEGSFPCDVDYEAGYALVGCLHGPDRDKGAPIYLLKGGKVISTIMPKEDLGLSQFQSIHNAVLIEREGKLYIVALAWNPGDFAILEQVTD